MVAVNSERFGFVPLGTFILHARITFQGFPEFGKLFSSVTLSKVRMGLLGVPFTLFDTGQEPLSNENRNLFTSSADSVL